MIKGISYWSFDGGLDGTCPPETAISNAQHAGFGAIELAIAETGLLTPSTDKQTCEKYRAAADSCGVRLETLASGMSWGCSPTSTAPVTRAKSIRLHEAALQRAQWLGAKAMLFVPGAVKIPWDSSYRPPRYDAAVSWAREAITQLLQTADRVGVDLCIENVWNGLFYSPLELAEFVDSFKSSRLGVYFDVGNVLGYHQHPPHWIEILARRIKRVHLKDFKASVGNLAGFCDLLEGDVPWPETMSALRAIGYDQTLIAEMIPHAPGLLERTSTALDRIVSM